MKKIKALCQAAVLVAATSMVVVGGSYAMFNNTTTNAPINVTSGNLVLNSERDNGDVTPGPMFYVTGAQGATPMGVNGKYPTGPWAPGDTKTRTLTVFNSQASGSNMDAWLDSVDAVLEADSPVDSALADKLTVIISTTHEKNETVNGEETFKVVNEEVARGSLREFLSGDKSIRYPDGSRIPLYLGGNRPVNFTINFDRLADNTYQGKGLIVKFNVKGVQMKNNP